MNVLLLKLISVARQKGVVYNIDQQQSAILKTRATKA